MGPVTLLTAGATGDFLAFSEASESPPAGGIVISLAPIVCGDDGRNRLHLLLQLAFRRWWPARQRGAIFKPANCSPLARLGAVLQAGAAHLRCMCNLPSWIRII